jgi:heme/copper-type cytochrome/quinol oxidase subunit 3
VNAEALDFPLGLAQTGILLASSFTMAMAVRSLRRKDVEQYWLAMGFTVLLALSFLFVKLFEWGEKIEFGGLPWTSRFLAHYYAVTGVHALLVFAGFLANASLLAAGFTLWSREPDRLTRRVAAAGVVWQVVCAAWAGIFVILYIL